MSNVVKLKPAPEPEREATELSQNDKRIIRECVAYAQCIGAASAGFSVDPCGSSDFAGPTAEAHYQRARASLERLAKLKATSPEALQAKARTVPVVVGQSCGSLEDHEFEFIEAFAADVKAYLDDNIEERWIASLDR